MKPIYTLNDYFKEKYHEKWIKLSLDGGMTCPNRDGTIDDRGCIFCSVDGSGEYAGINHLNMPVSSDILSQIHAQKQLLAEKWPKASYLAYFQNYTNTYASIDYLKALYALPFEDPDIKGLVIATRPDCITEEMLPIFVNYHKTCEFWLEFGLQTIHEASAQWMRRHYTLDTFESVYQRLSELGIKMVIHFIVGLPGETKASFLESIDYISRLKPFGVKLQMLNVLKHTDLAAAYEKGHFQLLDESAYIEWVCDAIERLDPKISIHRLTGDGAKHVLVAPKWVLNKRSVLNGIQKTLAQRGSVQGCLLK